MKKLWTFGLLVVAVLAMAASSHATMPLGVKAGGSLAKFTGDDAEGAKSKFGFAVGVFAQLPLNEAGTLMLQPEALYVMKGMKSEAFGNEGKMEVDYIEIPVLVRFMIPTQGRVKPNLFAGPALGLNLRANASSDALDFDVEIDNARSTEFSLAIGGGFDVLMATGARLTFDVRYTMGLTQTFDDPPLVAGRAVGSVAGNYTARSEVKNNVFMFMLGYGF